MRWNAHFWYTTLGLVTIGDILVMRTKYLRLVGVGILFFSFLSAAVFATPEEDFARAEISFNREDMKEATRLLRLAADQNYLPAQVRLGELMKGAEDFEEAFGWFLSAAFQGDAEGQYNVGMMYALGEGTNKSPEKALYWTKKAGEQNNLAAVKLLAISYSSVTDDKGSKLTVTNALGVMPSQEQADFWNAKLPELQEVENKRERKAQAAAAKKRAEDIKKAREEQSKLLCGLKC